MYRNNFRSPQMGGQPRPNMVFSNRGCGMPRPCPAQGNNCGATQPGNDCCEPENGCCGPEPRTCCDPEPCCMPERGACCDPEPCCVPERGACCDPEPCCVPEPCCAPPQGSMPRPGGGGRPSDDPDYDCFPSKQDPVAGMALAMAYVPWQDYRNICSEEEAWCRGTIFAQLDLDFMARRCN